MELENVHFAERLKAGSRECIAAFSRPALGLVYAER